MAELAFGADRAVLVTTQLQPVSLVIVVLIERNIVSHTATRKNFILEVAIENSTASNFLPLG